MRTYFAGAVGVVREWTAAYGRHAGSQHAAAIAYRVLFSLVPFIALVVSVFDLVMPSTARERLIDWLFEEIPGTEIEASIDRALAGSGAAASLVGLVALIALLWGATGMMAAIRTAFRVIWDEPARPSYVRGKLRDFALVALAGALVVGAFALSVVAKVVAEAGAGVSLGGSGAATVATALAEIATSGLVVFVALLALYRLVPPVRSPLADLWPSALAAAVAFEFAMAGFAFYAAHVANHSSVYGPIGTVLLFLLLVYVLAIVVLLGAETAAARGLRRSAEVSG